LHFNLIGETQMKKFKTMLFVMLLFVFSISSVCFGAATVAVGDRFVQITAIDADWLWTDTFGATNTGIYVDWIAFKPGAASDKCSIKDGSATGVEIFPAIPRADTTDGQIIYYGGRMLRPVIDYSAGTFSSGHQVTIMFFQ